MKLLLAVVILMSSFCFSQMQNMAEDHSGDMKNARKVAVFINLGPTSPAQYQPDFDRAKKQIGEKLKRQKLQLVAAPKDADLILVVNEYNASAGAVASSHTYGSRYGSTTTTAAYDRVCLGDEIKVFKGGKTPLPDDAPIWSANDSCGISWPLNRVMDKFRNAIKK
jgi:hypothetical protein